MTHWFDAWYLPGLRNDELSFATYTLGALSARAPVLTAAQLTRVLAHVENARTSALRTSSLDEIVWAIDGVASRLADAQSAEGSAARMLLPAVTGYSPQTTDDILLHMTRDWRSESLRRLLVAELGDIALLDAPTHDVRNARYVVARGPRIAYQVFSGNVPGVAVTSLIRCLLVRSASLGKTAAGEPVLPVLFARALADIAPNLAEGIAVTYWPGGTDAIEDVALKKADTVIIYGGAETVSAIARRTSADQRVIVHGPKLSIGIVGRAATLDVAPEIARAVAAYDQQGCVSPHVVYVEREGTVNPKQLARAIAAALADLALTYPRRTLDAAEALAIREARASAEFRAIAGADTEVYASADTSYTVIYDDDRALTTSCLNRTLYVKPIDAADAIGTLLEPHRGIMQSVALAGFSAIQAHTLTILLANCGVTRVTTFKHLPWPPMWWHHDGRGPLRELLTWHDIEREL